MADTTTGKSSTAAAAAAEAQAELDALINDIPMANPMDVPAFPVTRLVELRQTVARRIVALQDLMA
jgi:hypothetical protein